MSDFFPSGGRTVSKLAAPTQNHAFEPPFDDIVGLLRRMPQRPMAARHLATSEVGDHLLHSCTHCRNEYVVVLGLDEEERLSRVIWSVLEGSTEMVDKRT